MLAACVGCGGRLTDAKVRGLGACPTCGHYTIYKPIGAAKYNREYFEKYNLYENTELGRRINETRWALVGKYLNGKKLLLDWGCGNGSFIRNAPNGFCCFGHDLNPFSPYKHERLASERMDAVTLWDVIEHMERPEEFVGSLKTGCLFIVTPDVASIENIETWKHYRPDEHQHYFTVDSMVRMLARAGYDLREINRDEAELRDAEHPDYLVTFVAQK